jgi:uncharacterized circularly permuted ATP-grasp superfamily protein
MKSPDYFDEMQSGEDGCRPAYRRLKEWLDTAPAELLTQRRLEAEFIFRRSGITFAVYGEQDAEERIIPFDIIPRILTSTEWARLARGLEQRVKALNAFLRDIYGPREILRANILPPEIIYENPGFCAQMAGARPAGGIFVHIAGIDVVRVDGDDFYVLEDNARTPSGVSYMLENREAMIRLCIAWPRSKATPKNCWRRCIPWRFARTAIRLSFC